MEWTIDATFALIDKYEARIMLWQPKDPRYYNQVEKNIAWEEIAAEMSLSVDECKKRMCSLHSSLRREKGKMRKFLKSTKEGTDKVYRSSWFAYNKLAFLLDRRHPKAIIHLDNNAEVNSEDIEEVFPIEEEETASSCESPAVKDESSSSAVGNSLKRKTQMNDDESNAMLGQALKIMKKCSNSIEDECQSFGNFIANKLRSYTDKTRSAAEHAIGNLIFEADQGHLETNYPAQEAYKTESENDISCVLRQKCVIEFCAKIGKNVKQTVDTLHETYKSKTLSRAIIKEWLGYFKGGKTLTEDETWSGISGATLNNAIVQRAHDLLLHDKRITLQDLSVQLNVPLEKMNHIVSAKLGMSKVCGRWIPTYLGEDQKQLRQACCRQNVELFGRNPKCLSSIITCDEFRIKCSDAADKKLILILFYDSKGAILQHWVPDGQVVNDNYYAKTLNVLLKQAILDHRPEYMMNQWFLLQSNERSRITDFLGKHVQHPLYSPDLSPCDFWLFPTLQTVLDTQCIGSRDQLVRMTDEILEEISRGNLLHVFEKWIDRCKKCIASEGRYFDKESKIQESGDMEFYDSSCNVSENEIDIKIEHEEVR